MNTVEYLLQLFEGEGIHHLFMVPGFHVDPIMSALGKFPTFTGIVAAHEGGAAMMADGYAKVSGKFGVAVGIGGPGITNMMTGITTAYSDKTPIFIITGDAETDLQGRGSFQDTSPSNFDANTFLTTVTNKRLVITHPDTVKPHISSLLRNMLGTNRGPVQITIPSNLENQEIDETVIPHLPETSYHPRNLDSQSFKQIWDYLKDTNKIVVLAGMGALHSEASEELLRFAENFEIPVATTLAGKSIFPEDHRLSLGMLNWFGNPRAIETILGDEVEVLIVLGSRLNQVTTAKWSKDFLPNKALIMVDINENSYFGNYDPDLFVLGDIKTFLKKINNSTEKTILENSISARKNWVKQILKKPKFYDDQNLNSNEIPIHPARVINELRTIMPKNTILFSGEGASGFIASHYWTCYGPRQHFSQVKSMSPMGWSIPAAIGGKIAKPDIPVVSIIGDGSMLMHGLEIQTAARYQIPVIFILLDNQAHGNPQLRARAIGNFETNFLNLPSHDWAKIAESLGLVGLSVTHPAEISEVLNYAYQLKKPVLVHIKSGNYKTPVKISPF